MKRIPLGIFILVSISINAQSLDDLNWLRGKWINNTGKYSSLEVWEKNSDGSFSGYGLTLADGDTVFYEELRIISINDTVYYQAKIEDQNNGEPVLFRFIKKDPDFVFLNREHDFPQVIKYTPRSDTLFITLEGIEEYYEKKIDLIYHKDD